MQSGLTKSFRKQITTKNYSIKRSAKNAGYGGSFMKSATLRNTGEEEEFEHKEEINPVILKVVSDEDLLRACNGRTAHK